MFLGDLCLPVWCNYSIHPGFFEKQSINLKVLSIKFSRMTSQNRSLLPESKSNGLQNRPDVGDYGEEYQDVSEMDFNIR